MKAFTQTTFSCEQTHDRKYIAVNVVYILYTHSNFVCCGENPFRIGLCCLV